MLLLEHKATKLALQKMGDVRNIYLLPDYILMNQEDKEELIQQNTEAGQINCLPSDVKINNETGEVYIDNRTVWGVRELENNYVMLARKIGLYLIHYPFDKELKQTIQRLGTKDLPDFIVLNDDELEEELLVGSPDFSYHGDHSLRILGFRVYSSATHPPGSYSLGRFLQP